MRSGLVALLVVGVVLFGLGAGTWAYFSDTEVSAGNYIQAGTLDLVVNGVGTFDASLDEGDGIAPGDSGSWDITLQNSGTVNGLLTATFANYQYIEGTPDSIDEGTSDLRDVVYITMDLDGTPVDLSAFDTNNDGKVSLTELENQTIDLGPLNAASSKTLTVHWEIDPDADNGIQGDKIQFDINFALTQSHS